LTTPPNAIPNLHEKVIEHSWGCSKNEYRGKHIKLKWKKENFRQTGRDYLSRDVLTTERV
jgi:hypothetical protein